MKNPIYIAGDTTIYKTFNNKSTLFCDVCSRFASFVMNSDGKTTNLCSFCFDRFTDETYPEINAWFHEQTSLDHVKLGTIRERYGDIIFFYNHDMEIQPCAVLGCNMKAKITACITNSRVKYMKMFYICPMHFKREYEPRLDK
ncbi:MAG: hypothetical protein ACTSRA_00670 [Promethearchaeota archaeon]|nr:MAG: hypothetical protein [Helarchaeota virus Nidhogg Meg22_1012]URC17471.1 MAG: hypothetical protein [Helarchaeota virus Nidhogg Meg22_1214]